MMREKGGVSGKVTLSLSSEAQSLPIEKRIPERIPSIVVWNQILQFALGNKTEETRHTFRTIPCLYKQDSDLGRNDW